MLAPCSLHPCHRYFSAYKEYQISERQFSGTNPLGGLNSDHGRNNVTDSPKLFRKGYVIGQFAPWAVTGYGANTVGLSHGTGRLSLPTGLQVSAFSVHLDLSKTSSSTPPSQFGPLLAIPSFHPQNRLCRYPQLVYGTYPLLDYQLEETLRRCGISTHFLLYLS